jgi:osmotically-inducible protein OsmY
MFILRMFVIVLVVVAAGFLLLGYLGGSAWSRIGAPPSGVETPDSSNDSVARARQRGAEIGERAAEATQKAEETLNEASLTAKIKAKMALDDTVKASAINVTTRGTTVTLSGTVSSQAERNRALSLARETDGVAQVIDDLHIR